MPRPLNLPKGTRIARHLPMNKKYMLSRILAIVALGLSVLTPTYLYSWELGLSLDLFSEQKINPINYQNRTFYLGGHALTRSFVENFVSNFVHTMNPDQRAFDPFTLMYCPNSEPTNLGHKITSGPPSCKTPQFLAVLSPLKVGDQFFYLTARHAIQGMAYSGDLVFDSRFELPKYSVIEAIVPFSNESSVGQSIKSDLLIFIPNSYIKNQCHEFNAECRSQIIDMLTLQFVNPNVKSFWLALQPDMHTLSKKDSSSLTPWIYSSGIIDSTDPFLDQIISIKPNQPMVTLTKNISNHSLPGTSGGLIKSLDLNNSRIGANLAMIICDTADFTFALDIKKLLTDFEIQLNPIELQNLIFEKETETSLNIQCRAIDGRKGGGYLKPEPTRPASSTWDN